MIRNIIVGGFLMISVGTFAAAAPQEWVDDPSAVPLPRIEGEMHFRSGERWRFRGDFNDDGVEDVALSMDTKSFGNGGGIFDLYLGNSNGKYMNIGSFHAHPSEAWIALEKYHEGPRLWTYLHGGSARGSLGYYEINDSTMSEVQAMIIHPGDHGTNMGKAIVRAVFDNSDGKFTLERSETVDGIVRWKWINDLR